MAGTSTAGVEFSRDLMRYAEVEQNDGHLRLLRLGNCAFEFDAEAVLFEGQVGFVAAWSDPGGHGGHFQGH